VTVRAVAGDRYPRSGDLTLPGSLGLIIERPILALLNIDENTPLEVRTDGERLIFDPWRRPALGGEADAEGSRRDAAETRQVTDQADPEFLELEEVLDLHRLSTGTSGQLCSRRSYFSTSTASASSTAASSYTNSRWASPMAASTRSRPPSASPA
jgi:hypothetical protein